MHLELVPYFFLLLAVLVGWAMDARTSLLLLSLAVVAGLAMGSLTHLSLVWISALGISVWLPQKLGWTGGGRAFCYGTFLLLALGLLAHRFPGFQNLSVYQDVRFSADTVPFSMQLGFDQTVAGLFAYLFFVKPRQAAAFGRERLRITLQLLGLLCALMFSLALAIGYVRFDLKFPQLGWIWVLNNLFFVCLAEEALFRGVIQGGLSRLLPTSRIYNLIPVVLSSVLFGLAHFQGGVPLMGLATVAGVFFGYAYWKSKRLESPVLIHFSLNLIHFVLFSYPALDHGL